MAAHLGWRSRRYLPHCDAARLTQHIVFNLADALPRDVRLGAPDQADVLLDAGRGECVLRQADVADIVQDCLLYDDDVRYRLIAWCVMPNHVHVLIEQIEGQPLGDIVQAWKSVSAHRINRLLSRKGRPWAREYFDRYMRDDAHLSATVAYIERNPIAAGLVTDALDWEWSSAARRMAC